MLASPTSPGARPAWRPEPHRYEATLPASYPPVTVLSIDDPEPGKIFITPFGWSAAPPVPNHLGPLVIVDNLGMPIFYRKLVGLNFELQEGKLTYWDQHRAKYYAMDSAYVVVDSFAAGHGLGTDAHDLKLLPDGHALVIGVDLVPVRMDSVIAGGDPNAFVSDRVIQELDEAGNVVFQWRCLDHIPILDADRNDVPFRTPVVGPYTINAVTPTLDGNLLASLRHQNQIVKIDRSTGEIIWRMGANGARNDFTFPNDPRGFSHQHDVRQLANGHITLFDNGDFLDPQYSRGVEYEVDEVNMTATLVREWRQVPDTYGHFIGGMQPREGGGVMISWGGNADPARVTDFHPDGSVALELSFSGDTTWTYRASRHPWKTTRFTTGVDSLAFGVVRTGNSGSLPLVVRNPSGDDLEITDIVSSDASFAMANPVPFTIAPGDSATVTVAFMPTAEGAVQGNLYLRNITDTELVARSVVVTGTGSESPQRAELSLEYPRPNPTTEGFSVSFALASSAPAVLELLDISGRRVQRWDVGSMGGGTHTLNLADHLRLSQGVYLVRLSQASRSVSVKVAVIR